MLATTSITQIANFGLSGSVVKFVARYLAKGADITAAEVLQTAAISIALIAAVALLAAYPVLRWLLVLVIPAGSLGLAQTILPYATLGL